MENIPPITKNRIVCYPCRVILADINVSNMHVTVARRQLLEGIGCLESVIWAWHGGVCGDNA